MPFFFFAKILGMSVLDCEVQPEGGKTSWPGSGRIGQLPWLFETVASAAPHSVPLTFLLHALIWEDYKGLYF